MKFKASDTSTIFSRTSEIARIRKGPRKYFPSFARARGGEGSTFSKIRISDSGNICTSRRTRYGFDLRKPFSRIGRFAEVNWNPNDDCRLVGEIVQLREYKNRCKRDGKRRRRSRVVDFSSIHYISCVVLVIHVRVFVARTCWCVYR